MRGHPTTPAHLATTVRRRGVRDARLLEAIERVPRAGFVPPDVAVDAYVDVPLRIDRGQVTTQPSLVAQMVEALGLAGTERVLEVGTGYGWQTALLAALAAEVWSVERWPEIADAARAALAARGVENAHVVVGDGTEGLPEHAPYEAVIVSAAFERVPAPLADQVADGGRLVMPIGPGGADDVVLFERAEGGLEASRSLTGAYFVRLVGRHGFRDG
jgi:protein-L-isoaspartate(D-aspartate) O-methyltransferase